MLYCVDSCFGLATALILMQVCHVNVCGINTVEMAFIAYPICYIALADWTKMKIPYEHGTA